MQLVKIALLEEKSYYEKSYYKFKQIHFQVINEIDNKNQAKTLRLSKSNSLKLAEYDRCDGYNIKSGISTVIHKTQKSRG